MILLYYTQRASFRHHSCILDTDYSRQKVIMKLLEKSRTQLEQLLLILELNPLETHRWKLETRKSIPVNSLIDLSPYPYWHSAYIGDKTWRKRELNRFSPNSNPETDWLALETAPLKRNRYMGYPHSRMKSIILHVRSERITHMWLRSRKTLTYIYYIPWLPAPSRVTRSVLFYGIVNIPVGRASGHPLFAFLFRK